MLKVRSQKAHTNTIYDEQNKQKIKKENLKSYRIYVAARKTITSREN